MTNVEDFGKKLFSTLVHIIFQEGPEISEKSPKTSAEGGPETSEGGPETSEGGPETSAEGLETSEESSSSVGENLKMLYPHDDVSRSILVLSYAYRAVFIETFFQVRSILMRAEENSMIYIRCFAETSHKKYSPLKFLIVCSFISEIFAFLSQYGVSNKKQYYVEKTTEALNDVYQSIFKNDFSQNGWTDIHNEASKLAKAYPFLKHFMDNEDREPRASKIAEEIIGNKYKPDHSYQLTNIPMVGITSQMMGSDNTPLAQSSQAAVNIPLTQIPIFIPEGLLSKEISCIATTPASQYSFGTVNENPYLSYLLHASCDQTAAVTFENQPSGIEPNAQNEIIEPSNVQSQVQENLTAKSSIDEIMPLITTIELQAQENSATKSSGDEPLPSFETILPSNTECQAQDNLTPRSSGDKLVSSFLSMKLTDDRETDSCSSNN